MHRDLGRQNANNEYNEFIKLLLINIYLYLNYVFNLHRDLGSENTNNDLIKLLSIASILYTFSYQRQYYMHEFLY